jgi:hypothetical protein
MERDDLEPKEQIVPKSPLSRHFIQAPVGRCYDAGFGSVRLRCSDWSEFTAFKETQQFRLQRERKVTDFIEEYGPLSG